METLNLNFTKEDFIIYFYYEDLITYNKSLILQTKAEYV